MLNSVTAVQKLSNDEYDNVLSSSIVFLDLIDASAVNTLIECLVRNTPVLVNRHPAVEAVLGCMYPFFFDNIVEASSKATNFDLVLETHIYLKSLPKNNLSVDSFIKGIEQIL